MKKLLLLLSQKKSHQKWDFYQNYIKFTKDPKQTKILILQFAKSIAVGHSYFWKNKNRLVYLKNKSWLIHAIFFFFFHAIFLVFFWIFFFLGGVFCFFFIKASLFLHHTITSQTNNCHTCIFTGDHVVVGEKMLEYTFLMGNSLHTGSTWYNW